MSSSQRTSWAAVIGLSLGCAAGVRFGGEPSLLVRELGDPGAPDFWRDMAVGWMKWWC